MDYVIALACVLCCALAVYGKVPWPKRATWRDGVMISNVHAIAAVKRAGCAVAAFMAFCASGNLLGERIVSADVFAVIAIACMSAMTISSIMAVYSFIVFVIVMSRDRLCGVSRNGK